MKLPSFIENTIIRLAISKSGPLLTKGMTAAVAAALAYLATKFPGSEHYLNEYVLTGLLWLLLDYLYERLPTDIQKKYGKEIQQLFNRKGADIPVDGVIGPVTVKAGEKLIDG
jgi:hypothetical protein